jgi:hypothetical protein
MNPKRLLANKPENRDRYIKNVMKMLKKDNNAIPAAAATLRAMVDAKENPVAIMWHHHRLLTDNDGLRLAAANDQSHIFLGKYEWSPKWQVYADAVAMWKKAVR